jgi:adenylyltransferase/sulfurtransferase
MKEITVKELKAKKDRNKDYFLLDVREDWEYMISNIDGVHIPLGDLPNRIVELDEHKNSQIIVMCRAGGRSAKAVELLEANGFKDVTNLKGGITAWGKEIDPSIPVA